MKKIGFIAVAFLGIAFLMTSCSSKKTGNVLADINGEEITESDVEFLGTINPRIKVQIANPAGRKKILDNMIEQELLYQEAVKQGINRNDDVKLKSDLYRRVIIAQALVENEMDKSAQKYYEDNKDEFNKLQLSHIMVKYASPEELKKVKKSKKRNGKKKDENNLKSEKEALDVILTIKERLGKGEDFAVVAKEVSEDVATKNRGGDLGPASKDDPRLQARGFGPLIEKAAQIKVGEIAGPIKTDKGYHLITVTQGFELIPYEQAKNSIMFKVRGNAKDELVSKLKKEAKITFPQEEKALAKRKELQEKAKKLAAKAATKANAVNDKATTAKKDAAAETNTEEKK